VEAAGAMHSSHHLLDFDIPLFIAFFVFSIWKSRTPLLYTQFRCFCWSSSALAPVCVVPGGHIFFSPIPVPTGL